MQTESAFVRHVPCDSCGSSDANSLYDDGHTFCFACNTHTQGEDIPESTPAPKAGLLPLGTFRSLEKRKISEETCRKFGYSFGTFNGQPVQIAPYCNTEGAMIGQKLRFANKDFMYLGDSKGALLFGQNLWRDGGKMIVITEGELDAMSVSQIQDNKWPVVSIRNGAAGARKDLQKSLEWLERFETVVLMFDNDEPGRKAARSCAELFTPGKCKIASLPLKDASDMLQASRTREVIDAIWGAKECRPDGIVAGTDLWDSISKEDENDAVPYPFGGLNDTLHGIRRSEIVTFAAGSGVGKSAIVREIAYDLHRRGETIGYLALEESVKRTGLLFCGLELNKRLHISREGVSEEALRTAFDSTVGSGRFFLYDHFGSVDSENLLSRIRYLAKGCNCSTIVLDHISIAVSGNEEGDERRLLDNLMTNLRALVQELNVRLLLVSHLKRPQGKGHEEGAQTSLAQLRGTAGIGQLSDAVIGLERDQQDPANKFITCVRVLKNRFSGETGEACYLKYDKDTGRLSETAAPDQPAGESIDTPLADGPAEKVDW